MDDFGACQQRQYLCIEVEYEYEYEHEHQYTVRGPMGSYRKGFFYFFRVNGRNAQVIIWRKYELLAGRGTCDLSWEKVIQNDHPG